MCRKKRVKMPSQTAKSGTVFFVEFDNAPALTETLKNLDGEAIDLTDATVTISVAFSMPRGTYYTSPRDQIVKRSPCVVDPDQVANKGVVHWTPGAKGDDDALTPPGEFLYTFEVTYLDSTKQTVPQNTYFTLIIKTPVGGRSLNEPLPAP